MNQTNMQDAEFQKLVESSWRRPLTPAEQGRLRELLASQPALRESWEREAALNRALQGLPSAAVSTNFTARVLQSVRQLPPRPDWRRWIDALQWPRARWVPRMALAAAMVCCGVLSFHEYQAARRARAARDVASVSRLAALPPVEWMKDFDTINRLNKVKVADDELLSALQ